MSTLQTLLNKADSYKANTAVNNKNLQTNFLNSSKSLNGNDIKPSETEAYGAAFDAMLQMAFHKVMMVTSDSFRELHRLLYQHIDPEQAGQYRTNPVVFAETGYKPPPADEIPRFMEHLADQISSSRFSLHPIELAAMVMKRLIDIHPFQGGNVQIAILLMNLILVNAGYVVISIPPERRGEYQNALAVSRQQYDMEPFSRLIAECIIETYQGISR